jgi:lipoprotein NlpI
MNRLIVFWFLLVTAALCPAAESPESFLRSINTVARTNFAAALALCDQAVARFPSNAQPLSVRARLLEGTRRYEDALRDLTAALQLEPKRAQFWQGRGEVNFKAGHFAQSVADFDRVIELVPDQAPHHWQRGLSLYYARRFTDGRKQFESHRTVNPNDVENAVWHFLCAARETSVTNARAIIVPAGPDARVPMAQVDALYRGTGTVEEVLAAARNSRSRDALFYAHLYLGLYHEALGETAKAREHIKLAAEDPTSQHYMGDVARVHWRIMQTR